ncbi:MAG TPA: aquaporin [Ilumatobacteraceae bacterium]|nr:aquaporin [Ilumatobacteraceae bacterium]
MAILRDGQENYGRIFVAELFGTAVLMLGGLGLAILAGASPAMVAVGFGLTLMILVYILGPISGAHVNPAVTLGMLLTKKITPRWAVTAWIAQFVGGALGAAIIWGIAQGREPFVRGNFGSNGWNRVADTTTIYSGIGAVMIIEVVLTALLVMVMLFAAARRFAPSMVGVVAGSTMLVGYLLSQPIDGGAMNPARSLGAALFAQSQYDALKQVWLFIVFPLIGAVVGTVLWLVLDEARLEDTYLAEVPGATVVRDALDGDPTT